MVPDEVWEFYMTDCSLYPDQYGPSVALYATVCLPCWNTRVDWKDAGEFERTMGKPAFLWYWHDPGGDQDLERVGHTGEWTPIPPGGYLELECMSDAERAEWYRWAESSGYWNWIPDARRRPTNPSSDELDRLWREQTR